MGYEPVKSLAARTPLYEYEYHCLRCLLFLLHDFVSLSPLLILGISWSVSHCLLVRRRRVPHTD